MLFSGNWWFWNLILWHSLSVSTMWYDDNGEGVFDGDFDYDNWDDYNYDN